MLSALVSMKELIVLLCYITLCNYETQVMLFIESEARVCVGGSWDAWFKTYFSRPKSGLSQEGALFLLLQLLKEASSSARRHISFDPEKSRAFCSRTWETYDLERPRIFRALHVFVITWPTDIYCVRDLLILEINCKINALKKTCRSLSDKSGKNTSVLRLPNW